MADRTRTVAVDVDQTEQQQKRSLPWPWQLIAVVGALLVALAGWVLVGGVTTMAWLSASDDSLRSALGLATQFFALAHGAGITLGGHQVSIVPLGLTTLLIFLGVPVSSFVARQAQTALPENSPEQIVWRVAGIYALAYSMASAIGSGAIIGGGALGPVFVGGVLVGMISGLWGASCAVHFDPTMQWPMWLRVVPRALGVAVLGVISVSAVVLAIGVWQGRGRIVALVDGLAPDTTGLFALVVIHLCYLPNFVLWLSSWVVGAGFTLGDGSNLTPLLIDVGVQPAFPIFGAVPEPGPIAGHWWLVTGVVAGLLAGLAVAWARPKARFDESALSGGLAGGAAGLLITLLASSASGSLGVGRLAHVGARIDLLLIIAPSMLGLAGALGGVALGLARVGIAWIKARPSQKSDQAREGATESVGGELRKILTGRSSKKNEKG